MAMVQLTGRRIVPALSAKPEQDTYRGEKFSSPTRDIFFSRFVKVLVHVMKLKYFYVKMILPMSLWRILSNFSRALKFGVFLLHNPCFILIRGLTLISHGSLH